LKILNPTKKNMISVYFPYFLLFFLGIWIYLNYRKMSALEMTVRKQAEEERLLLEEKLEQTIKILSQEALEKNNRSFLALAQEQLTPVKESLRYLDQGMRQLEKERKGDHESLKSQVRSLLETEKELRTETSNLVKALRAPIVRGRWGEIQLKRVVELAGMLSHCDFEEQKHDGGGDVKMRPDLVVNLPGGRQVIVDAKVPLEAFLDAAQSQDDREKLIRFKDHARQVRAHVTALSRKAYWERFQPTPEFVILFLPSEAFFSAALEHDPSLIEVGAEGGVIIATPTTLIALLRTVAYGWKQENLTEHVQKVSDLAHELYKRLCDMSSHWHKMGRSLSASVEAYNKAVGSLEARVLPAARKFKDLGAASSSLEIDPIEAIERIARTPESLDLT
jgi:DNA recombination protein RmuC